MMIVVSGVVVKFVVDVVEIVVDVVVVIVFVIMKIVDVLVEVGVVVMMFAQMRDVVMNVLVMFVRV